MRLPRVIRSLVPVLAMAVLACVVVVAQAPAAGGRQGAAGRAGGPPGPPPPQGVPREPLGDGPWSYQTAEQVKFRLVVVTKGLVNPWDLVFLPDGSMEVGIEGLTLEKDREPEGMAAPEKTTELPPRVGSPPSPKNVKIPHNPNIPMKFKVERCRNCVIYNEHQRHKYLHRSVLPRPHCRTLRQ